MSRNLPAVAPCVTRYRGEADDLDNPSSALSAPLIPLFTEGRVIAHHHYPRISRFRLIRRSLPLYHPGPSPCHLINRLLPSCCNHSRSIITSTSHRSNPSHAGHGTQLLDGYYLHYFTPVPTGAWLSSLSVASVFWVALASRASSAGVECSCCPPYTRTKYISEFSVDKEKEGRETT